MSRIDFYTNPMSRGQIIALGAARVGRTTGRMFLATAADEQCVVSCDQSDGQGCPPSC